MYSGKVRCYLRKKAIPYREKYPSIITYKRFILPRTGVRFIPVLHTPEDQVLQDTTVIIDALEARFPELPVYPDTPRQRFVSLLLELFGDEWLLLPAMHYRWNFPADNDDFLFREFGGLMFPWLPGFVRKKLGRKIARRFQGYIPMLGITEQTGPALEAWFEALLADLGRHFEHHLFLLGGRPTLADFAFAGPLYGHLSRDPYPARLLRAKSPHVMDWIGRMTSTAQFTGPLLPADAIPDSLLPILSRCVLDQLPYITDTSRSLDKWASGKPAGTLVPRSIGRQPVNINGRTAERLVLPYSVWMFQRPYDYYRKLTDPERQPVAELLAGLGGLEPFEEILNTRLDRRGNRTCLA